MPPSHFNSHSPLMHRPPQLSTASPPDTKDPPAAAEAGDAVLEAHGRIYFQSYSHIRIQESMIKDRVRTDAHHEAIMLYQKFIKGKVVMDVGCGTGILSVFCARAGTKRGKNNSKMVLWVFGYVSLIWNPGFDFDEKILGFIKGYKRTFNLACIDHRGTPQNPARTCTFESEGEAICISLITTMNPISTTHDTALLFSRSVAMASNG